MPKSWGLTFMINDHDAPTGRPAGSLAWAGLANLFFWIDRRHGLGGFWATQILPFADAASVSGYLNFESATYAAQVQKQAA
jgi:methyl acetate hydrolase